MARREATRVPCERVTHKDAAPLGAPSPSFARAGAKSALAQAGARKPRALRAASTMELA